MTQKQRLIDEKGPSRQGWFSSTELAVFLGINTRTLRRWKQAGKLPAPKTHTISGWALWSPEQAQQLMRKRAHIT